MDRTNYPKEYPEYVKRYRPVDNYIEHGNKYGLWSSFHPTLAGGLPQPKEYNIYGDVAYTLPLEDYWKLEQ